ncbi:MAG TPA: DJ-1/PfpI family protein [Thermoanaerobaculia bacterium]|jgi:cyclohexyl-isocyanide hydratase|nr:DJ-1/PfpI family protein [Thermoanaerobaculia bacterium]
MASDSPRVVFPLYNGSTLLDFAGATQIFSFAGFQAVWAAPTMDPITTTENVQVLPGCTFADVTAQPIAVLFVPGGGSKVSEVMLDPEQTYIKFLQTAAPGAQFAGSVCTGAFLLATAGLLDGYEASTYWSQRENLALFPNVRVSAGYPRWVIHGTRFTGGGISSSIDLALELVSLISGPTQSMSTQLGTQYAPDPPFRSGDPGQAPPEVTTAARQSQGDFIATIRLAVEKVLGKV